ncbi:tRNA-modifying protein YgfZ [Glaciecola sp. MH2013]|nr:tRNA-modifying protein YgfZ [Glaciecola sp. MH2013]
MQGPQAADYLQGQITINTTSLDSLNNEAARVGAHCDFKGKTWAVYTAFKSNDVYSLICHADGLAKSLSEFKKYGVFSKVEIEDKSAGYCFYGVKGNDYCKTLQQHFTQLNTQHLGISIADIGTAICYQFSNELAPLYLIKVAQEREADFLESFNGVDTDVQELWDADVILSGFPTLASQVANEFVPQMLNLQAIAGIDFDKGCYMGQETIARTKFLGKNKRASYILESELNIEQMDAEQVESIETELSAGAALEKQAGENWRSGGSLLQKSVLKSESTLKVVALAVLSNDTELGAMIRLKANPVVEFTVLPLPYSLEDK